MKLSQISSIMDQQLIRAVQHLGIEKALIIEMQHFIKEYFENLSDLIPEHNINIRETIIFFDQFFKSVLLIYAKLIIILIKSLTNKH